MKKMSNIKHYKLQQQNSEEWIHSHHKLVYFIILLFFPTIILFSPLFSILFIYFVVAFIVDCGFVGFFTVLPFAFDCLCVCCAWCVILFLFVSFFPYRKRKKIFLKSSVYLFILASIYNFCVKQNAKTCIQSITCNV